MHVPLLLILRKYIRAPQLQAFHRLLQKSSISAGPAAFVETAQESGSTCRSQANAKPETAGEECATIDMKIKRSPEPYLESLDERLKLHYSLTSSVTALITCDAMANSCFLFAMRWRLAIQSKSV